jgi:hypothetical protein
LERGAIEHINVKSSGLGWTAVLEAARYGHADCLKMLLVNGAEIEALSEAGTNALMLAASSGSRDSTLLVLQLGGALGAAASAAQAEAAEVRRLAANVGKMAAAMGRKLDGWRPVVQRAFASEAAAHAAIAAVRPCPPPSPSPPPHAPRLPPPAPAPPPS